MQLSLHKRDELIVEELVGTSIASCFSGSAIEVADCFLDLLPRDGAKICWFWKELSKAAIGVFIDTSLSRGIGMGKVGVGLKRQRDRFMFHKL